MTCGEARKRFEKGGERVFDRTEHSHLIRTPGAIPVCHISSHQAGMWSWPGTPKILPTAPSGTIMVDYRRRNGKRLWSVGWNLPRLSTANLRAIDRLLVSMR